MIPDSNEKEVPTSTDVAHTQNTIFDRSDADMTGYDKNLKRARICLYVVAAIQLAVGIYQFFTILDDYGFEYALLNGGIIGGIGLVFLILAIWSYKKPSPAFLTALIFFISIHVANAIADPEQIIRGIFLKIIVLVLLIKGYQDAREYDRMKKAFGEEAL